MKIRIIYILILLSSLWVSQGFLVDKNSEDYFPLTTWNLFSEMPIERNLSFLYLKDINDGSLCYFYLCSAKIRSKLSPQHLYHLVLWKQDSVKIEDYLEDRIDLESLGYRIHIRNEITTMAKKWTELSDFWEKKKQVTF